VALGFSGDMLDVAIKRCFEHFYFQRSNFSLHKDIHSLLKSLSDRLPLVAITNGNVNLQQIGLDDYFSACFQASVELPMKPNKAMFVAAQAHLNISSENILHVGDNLQKDIYGALKAGYQTAWYAEDRKMNMLNEKALILPHVQLSQLTQLLAIV
jgi:HAD superfamily hydrolase (TIGR01549 family)